MHRDSVLIYNYEKGFGEVFWITCLVCWSSTRYVVWEDGSNEEHCTRCQEKEESSSGTGPRNRPCTSADSD